MAGQRWAASWCGGVGAFTVGAAMGGALVARGAGERSRDGDGRLLGVEGWGRAQSARRGWWHAEVGSNWRAATDGGDAEEWAGGQPVGGM